MKKTFLHRIVACIMIPVMLISAAIFAPTSAFSASSEEPYLTMNGERVSSVILQEDEKIRLTAVSDFGDSVGYRWQIKDYTQKDRWINISDEYAKTLAVSYAMVGSMLDAGGRAALRCRLTVGENQYYTEPVEVQVSYNVSENGLTSSYENAKSPMRAMFSARAQEEHTTYSIVINYLFDNNAIAFEPYGASVAKGSDFSASITSPTVVGYAPYRRVGEDYIDASVVELDLKNIQANVTINVIYEPALVDFSVHHHLQNLLDDDYSIHYDLITTSQALTGSVVGDGLALTEEQLPGFKSLAYEKLTVAADGSTVIEIRYDRNYYLIDFDMNGGYGTEPVYTRYGSTVGANNPTRHGYVFDGWELISYGGENPTAEQSSKYDISNGNTIIVPDANLKYRAKWITQETEYTMVFWKENANDDGYSYWGYLDGLSAMSGSYVSGQDWIDRVDGIDDEAYFEINSEKTEKNVLVEGDGSTVVNVYYTRNYYTITFKAKGLCSIPEGHRHTQECYDIVCGLGHIHTDECLPELICTQKEHAAHSDECIICGKEEHTHGGPNCACEKVEHTHTSGCWNNIGNQASRPTGAPSNPEDGQVYRYRSWGNYYIYIKGTWYRYTGRNASSGDIVDSVCGYDEEHTHGTNCSCDMNEHTHLDTCYKDVLHTHTDSCYHYSCDEVEHIHVEACMRLKCGITEGHTHSGTCKSTAGTNTVKTVHRKYQQSLEDIWPIVDDNGREYNSGERWTPANSTYYSNVLVYISKMTPDDFTLTVSEVNYDTFTMQYYLQQLPGDEGDVEYEGIQYELHNEIVANYNYITEDEDFLDITGFYQYKSNPSFSNGQIDINGGGTVKFYYKRITDHVIEFNNNGEVLTGETVSDVMYGASVKEYDFVPGYPDNLEPNAYAFAGWYTSPKCFAGTEVDWDTLTMPEGDLLLYAKWAPITHKVRVFKDASLTEQIGGDQIVDHKAFAYAPTDAVSNGNYVFQGWFYVDEVNGENVEKAFVFNGIPIVDDMDVYAKWSSHVSVEYKINYVLKNTGEPIADSTVGTAIAGHNKTFYAKAGEELYSGYQTGFYPLTNSHTVTMSVDGNHEFTFEYVYVESMPYKVQYLDVSTGESILADKVVDDNTLSVVTETFARCEGKMPDAYQKRLILTASGEDADKDGIYDSNVITFYYNSDEEHAYYHVVHYIQNIEGNTYREYRSEETVGNIGTEYTIEALALTGFEFKEELTKANGTLSPASEHAVTAKLGADGLLIELYYDRKMVDYAVYYIDEQTGEEIVSAEVGQGVFGAQILEYAKDLEYLGYELVSDELKLFTLSANSEHNVIEFGYQEKIISLKYQIVGPEGCGILSQYSENVQAIRGTAIGSLPTVSEGYVFEGWYTDPGCTVQVTPSMIDSDSNRLTPIKSEDSVWKAVTYYAKFNAKETELTIKTVSTAENDENQAFVFRITGKQDTDTAGIDLTVSIVGNGEATITKLPVGEYTVVELTDWSWRYENQAAKRELTLEYSTTGNVVEYDNSRQQEKWLDGNDVVLNAYTNTD